MKVAKLIFYGNILHVENIINNNNKIWHHDHILIFDIYACAELIMNWIRDAIASESINGECSQVLQRCVVELKVII